MADVPFLPCTPFWPGEIVVARPDIPLVVEHVHEVDLDATLTLTPEAPGFAKISWAGMLFKDITGATLAPATKEVRIGANLVLSSPAAGIARLDGTGGGGGSSFSVSGGPGDTLDIFPCLGIDFVAASGLKLDLFDVVFARVSLYEATPSQNGAVTTNPQSWFGFKTLLSGLAVGQPGSPGIGETMLSFVPNSLLAGGRAVLELLQAELDGLGGTDFSGQQIHADGDVCVFKGFTAGTGLPGGWNRTSLGVVDEHGTEYLGEWVAPPGSTGPPWTFAGGLLVGTLGALAWLTSVTGSASGMGLSLSSSTSGGVITLTLGGTLNVAHGGTGASTQAGAANAILPPQAGHATQVLTTDGTNVSWAAGGGGGGITSADSFDSLTLFG